MHLYCPLYCIYTVLYTASILSSILHLYCPLYFLYTVLYTASILPVYCPLCCIYTVLYIVLYTASILSCTLPLYCPQRLISRAHRGDVRGSKWLIMTTTRTQTVNCIRSVSFSRFQDPGDPVRCSFRFWWNKLKKAVLFFWFPALSHESAVCSFTKKCKKIISIKLCTVIHTPKSDACFTSTYSSPIHTQLPHQFIQVQRVYRDYILWSIVSRKVL